MIARWTFGFAAIAAACVLRAADEPTSAHDDAWVEARGREWEIRAEDRAFDQIGWARTLRDAERLAQQHNRPIFLFTHDGRIATGRC